MRSQVQQAMDDGYLVAGDDGRIRPGLQENEMEFIRSNRGSQSRQRPHNQADVDQINADLNRMEGEEQEEAKQ